MGKTPDPILTNLGLFLEHDIDPFFIFDQEGILFANTSLTTLLGGGESGLDHSDFIKNIITIGKSGLFSQSQDLANQGQSTFQLFDVPMHQEPSNTLRFDISIAPISWHGKHAHACLIKNKPEPAKSGPNPDHKVKVIGTIAAGIVHDINNMLTSLIGFSELAMEETRSMEKTQRYINEILTAANRAKDLIHKVLWVENLALPHKTDIVPILNSVVKLINVSFPQKTTITYMVEPKVYAMDGNDFFQLMLNLCINALQSMEDPKGKIHLIVDQKKIMHQPSVNPWEAHMGDYLLIEITDKGVGMDQATMNLMFDYCFTTRKNGQGNGIGLTIVTSIIRKYKGFIYLESQPGQGTHFKVYLPI